MLSETEKIQEDEVLRLRSILKIQTVALKAIHDFFEEREFMQLMPVILSPYTDPVTNGSSPDLTPGSIKYGDQELKLTQSMILNKQVAIGNGINKFYILSPNVRFEVAEKFYTGKHLIEFTQVDFEVKDAQMHDIFRLVETLIRRVRLDITSKAMEELGFLKRKLPTWNENFPIYTSHEMIEKFGEDWEDKASQDHSTPFFVTCHNRHFYDKTETANNELHFRNFTLFYGEGVGVALSGGERESDFDKIINRMKELGLSRYDYGEYLLRVQSGMIQESAGGGLGVERLIRYLVGAEHIGDIQLFRRIPGEKFVI